MTIAVDLGRKATKTNKQKLEICIRTPLSFFEGGCSMHNDFICCVDFMEGFRSLIALEPKVKV